MVPKNDPILDAINEALAAKTPPKLPITDEMRAQMLRQLISHAVNAGDLQAKATLVRIAREIMLADDPEATVDGWLEEARQELLAICADAKGPVIQLVPGSNADTPQSSEWPSQHWRGPRAPELPDRPPADDLSPEEQQARARSRLEAERYRSLRQAVYDTVDRSTSWMWRR
jgi:hypothetical protein